MRRVRLGRTGIEVSAVSLGTWGHGGPSHSGSTPVGWSGHDDALAREAIVTAWNHGIDHWDTADVYGDGRAEKIIGSVWDRVPRDMIFLASKTGWDQGGYGHYYHPELIRRRLERSLQNLATDWIDLYYMHHCDFGEDDQYLEPALEEFQRARDSGRIRFLGLSDWDAGKIAARVERIDPDVVQPFRNVVDDDWESSGLKDVAARRELGVAFFSPLKHGLLLGKYDEPAEFPEGDFRRNIEEFRDARFIARMQQAAGAMRTRFAGHSEPVLHAVVGSLFSDAPNSCVLLGQRNPEQAAAAATVGEALSPEEAQWVREQYR